MDGCDDPDDGDPDDDTDGGNGESLSVDAVVVPFGVFDAHAEAKRFW